MASIPVPTPVPVKSVADILSRLADCKDDAQRLRDSTPSMDYHAMNELKKQTGQERGWDVFVIWYPRLLRNLRDIAAGLRGSSSITVKDDERVAIGEKWDNFLKYFTQALSGTNSGCLKTNEMRIKFGPLVLQVYGAFDKVMRAGLAPDMRNYLPGSALRNGIDKYHDKMYDSIVEGRKKTQYRTEDIFMKGATDSYGDVLAWKRLAESRGVDYSVIANERRNDPISGIDENNNINIRLPLW
ncbi:hypothetical protein EG327_002289 [Venturia inaequalis]|uniref:Uncharacterized protein n=1 Tax=Venturia inaequalis TaxID=5025 RepID=A0A8H3ZBZ5_VENIN|nr:hypothetical protein EG327_002289 [Venturia inaequalis]